jgi:nitrous oxide reductase
LSFLTFNHAEKTGMTDTQDKMTRRRVLGSTALGLAATAAGGGSAAAQSGSAHSN